MKDWQKNLYIRTNEDHDGDVYLKRNEELAKIISVSISYPAIMTIYLFSQSLYVFRKKLSIRILNKFLLNILLFYLLNISLLSIFLEMLNFSPILAQLFIMVFFILFNFFFQKNFVFK